MNNLVIKIYECIEYLNIALDKYSTANDTIIYKSRAEELKDTLEKCRDVICEKEKEEIIAPDKNEKEIMDVVKRVLNLTTEEFEDCFGRAVDIVSIFDKYTISGIKAMLDSPDKPFHMGDVVLYYGKPHMFLQGDPDKNLVYLINSDGKLIIVDLQSVTKDALKKYKGQSRLFYRFLDVRQILSQLEDEAIKGRL